MPLTASKTWLAYRVLLDAAATNLVGVPHTFTATVQQTGVANPADADWVGGARRHDADRRAVDRGEGTIDVRRRRA